MKLAEEGKPRATEGPKSAEEAFDWAVLRDRFSRTLVSREEASPRAARAILEDRAARLARPAIEAVSEEQKRAVLCFALSGELFAIGAEHVCQVMRSFEVTPIPAGPDHLLGVSNAHGRILPVFDLGTVLAGQLRGGSEGKFLIVLGTLGPEFGFVADDVSSVHSLAKSELIPSQDSIGRATHSHVLGVTSKAQTLLDGASLLEDPRFIIDDYKVRPQGDGGGGAP